MWGVIVQQLPGSFRNRLLARLQPADRHRLAPHLTQVALPQRMSLVAPGEPIERCYFLESGVASVFSNTADGKQAEIGLIGREGMVDVSAVMGGVSTPLEVIIQMAASLTRSRRAKSGPRPTIAAISAGCCLASPTAS